MRMTAVRREQDERAQLIWGIATAAVLIGVAVLPWLSLL
jgi:hypothetical protein